MQDKPLVEYTEHDTDVLEDAVARFYTDTFFFFLVVLLLFPPTFHELPVTLALALDLGSPPAPFLFLS